MVSQILFRVGADLGDKKLEWVVVFFLFILFLHAPGHNVTKLPDSSWREPESFFFSIIIQKTAKTTTTTTTKSPF